MQIEEWVGKFGVPAELIIATLCTESGGDPKSKRQEPGNSIWAGTAYITNQWKITRFDPPKVACAYNAGGVYFNESSENRWRMRQYPINSSAHADRFVKWFNDCFIMFAADGINPATSFFRLLRP